MTKSDLAEIKEFALAIASGVVALCACVLLLPYYLCTEVIKCAETVKEVTSEASKSRRKKEEQELIATIERAKERSDRIKQFQRRNEVEL